jgi:beta-glucosidase
MRTRFRLFLLSTVLLPIVWNAGLRADSTPATQPSQYTRTAADAVTPTPNRHFPWWMKRHNDLVKLVAQHPDSKLIFVGDSITDVWQWVPSFQKYYGQYDALDLGISGDQTEHVLYRLEHGELTGLHPKVAVVLIGTNNTWVDTPEWIAPGVIAVVNVLHEKLPDTQVLLLAIFPRDAPDSKTRWLVEQTDRLLAEYSAPKTTYLDIGWYFLDANGQIPRSIMKDLLHPTAAGYEIWAKAMAPTLDALLK